MVKITVKIMLAIRENSLNPFHLCSHPAQRGEKTVEKRSKVLAN